MPVSFMEEHIITEDGRSVGLTIDVSKPDALRHTARFNLDMQEVAYGGIVWKTFDLESRNVAENFEDDDGGPADVWWELLLPYEGESDHLQKLQERFPDVPANKLSEFLNGDVFLRCVFGYVLGMSDIMPHKASTVKVVVLNEHYAGVNAPLPKVVERFFPNATLVVASTERAYA